MDGDRDHAEAVLPAQTVVTDAQEASLESGAARQDPRPDLAVTRAAAGVPGRVGPLSRLVRRTTVYWVGGAAGIVPQYMALENATGWVRDPVGYARQLDPQVRYAMVGQGSGYVVLRRE